jgi:hypothetical protein
VKKIFDCYEVNDRSQTVKHKQKRGKMNCLQILNGSKEQTTTRTAGPRRLPPAPQPPSGLVLRPTASLLPLARAQSRHHREREAPTAAPRIPPGRPVIAGSGGGDGVVVADLRVLRGVRAGAGDPGAGRRQGLPRRRGDVHAGFPRPVPALQPRAVPSAAAAAPHRESADPASPPLPLPR